MPSRGTYSKGAARREEILATALQVVAEQGYHRASLRGIGRALGLEPAHILYYFDSREDLLREVVERWDAGSLEAAGTDADAFEVFVTAIRTNRAIRGVVHLYLAFAAEAVDPGHPAHDFFQARFALMTRELATAVRAGQASGVVHAGIDPDRTARSLIARADGLQLQSLIDASVDAPADMDSAIDELFVSGVRSRIEHPARLSGHRDGHARPD